VHVGVQCIEVFAKATQADSGVHANTCDRLDAHFAGVDAWHVDEHWPLDLCSERPGRHRASRSARLVRVFTLRQEA
jgi:hypothetical protein